MNRQNLCVKAQLFPNKEQKKDIEENFRYSRDIYNHMLERKTKMYYRRKEVLSYYDMLYLLPRMKKYYPDLRLADSQALISACYNLDEDFMKFFAHKGSYPQKKVKEETEAYTTRGSIKISDNQIRLPKLGWISADFMDTIPEEGRINKAVVYREEDGKYYASVYYKNETDKDTKATNRNFIRKIKHYLTYVSLVLLMCLLLAIFLRAVH